MNFTKQLFTLFLAFVLISVPFAGHTQVESPNTTTDTRHNDDDGDDGKWGLAGLIGLLGLLGLKRRDDDRPRHTTHTNTPR